MSFDVEGDPVIVETGTDRLRQVLSDLAANSATARLSNGPPLGGAVVTVCLPLA